MNAIPSTCHTTESNPKPRTHRSIFAALGLLCFMGCEPEGTHEHLSSPPNRSAAQTDTTAFRKAKRMSIGSKAPALQVDHWITTGGDPLPTEVQFKPGRVYVVEFWATTCGPCIQTIPHLAELQRKYSEQGLQVIGVTSEPLALVTPFLAREIKPSEKSNTTIGEVANAYHLAADPDGSIDLEYMLASGIQEIPMAFVVGKQGLIEWIGAPLELDDVIPAILEDRWERPVTQQP